VKFINAAFIGKCHILSRFIPGLDLVQHAIDRNNANAKLLSKGAAFAAVFDQASDAILAN